MNESFQFLVEILRHYGYVLLFFGAIVGGETIIVAAAFLAFLGFFNIYGVIVLSLLGTVISDNLWYYIGSRGRNVISRTRKFLVISDERADSWKERFNTHAAKILLLNKFVYGTRIATLVAAGHEKFNYPKFFRLNLIGALVWLLVIIILAWAFGFSYQYLSNYSHYYRYWLLGALAAIIIARYVISKVIAKKEKI